MIIVSNYKPWVCTMCIIMKINYLQQNPGLLINRYFLL